MSERRVVITGTGLITSLGDSRQLLHDKLCSGQCGLKMASLFDVPLLKEKRIVGEITDFDPANYLGEHNFRPLDRTSQLLISAAQLALCDSHWTSNMLTSETVGLVVGTTFCSLGTISAFDRRALEEGPSCASPLDFANTVINAASGQTGIWHNLRGVNSTISSGITSSLEAIAYAAELIRTGQEISILAGGVEDICVESLLAFQRAGLLVDIGDDQTIPGLFSRNRRGFALSEGSALVMLEELDSALTRGATILGEFLGAGSCFDSSIAFVDSEQADAKRSASILSAIESAMHDAGLSPNQLGSISLGSNGYRFNDRAEVYACQKIIGETHKSVPVTAIKSMLGENMGASAAIQIIEAISYMTEGRMPGVPGVEASHCDLPNCSISHECRTVDVTNCLVSSVGLDGHCGVVVIGNLRSA
ncbi:MAG: beta-ketoacyl synthase N-terminal-like domain-containing protein [Pirellula sp.]